MTRRPTRWPIQEKDESLWYVQPSLLQRSIASARAKRQNLARSIYRGCTCYLLEIYNNQLDSLFFFIPWVLKVLWKNWTNLTGTATTFQYPNFGNFARLLTIQNGYQLMQTANKMTLTGRLEPAVNSWPPVLQSGDPDCCIHTDLPCYNIHPSCADDDGDPGAVFIRIRSIWIWMWTNFGTLVSIFFPTRRSMKMTKASMAVVVIITCILQYIASQRCHFHCDLLPSYVKW